MGVYVLTCLGKKYIRHRCLKKHSFLAVYQRSLKLVDNTIIAVGFNPGLLSVVFMLYIQLGLVIELMEIEKIARESTLEKEKIW